MFAERTLEMFRFLPDLLKMKNEEDFVKLFARIEKYEGISDACYNMARAINRKFHLEEAFTEEQYSRIENMMKLCDQALMW